MSKTPHQYIGVTYYYFKENNSEAFAHAKLTLTLTLNYACNHRNLHLFGAQRRIISIQHLGLFVRVWHAYDKRMHVAQEHGCGTHACAQEALAFV